MEFGGEARGRRAAQNFLTERSGLSCFDFPVGAFQVIFDNHTLKHIQQCANVDAQTVLGNEEWEVSLCELNAFIPLLYVRGSYGGKNFCFYNFWNKEWGVSFFQQTLSRNRCEHFDFCCTKSACLQTDKFALILDIWNRFVDNSVSCYKPGENIMIDQHLFPTKSRCRFTQYMPNKSDKFGTKFWLAVNMESKYILNVIPCLCKDESRPSNQRLSDNVVMTLMQPSWVKAEMLQPITFSRRFTCQKVEKEENQLCVELSTRLDVSYLHLPNACSNVIVVSS